jgi:hypothetical protein
MRSTVDFERCWGWFCLVGGKRVGLKAAALNGKHGVVLLLEGAAAPTPGRIEVELEGGGTGDQSHPVREAQADLA